MKAFAGVVVVLLLVGGPLLAQAGPPQQTVAEASRTEGAGPGSGLTTGLAAGMAADQASPSSSAAAADSTPSAETSAEAVPAVAAVSFGPGAKLYLEPMDGFAELLAEAMTKKKVPVVLVHDRAQADFVMSGDARLKKPGWFKGMVLYPHAREDLSITNAHTGEVVFAYKLDDKQESMSAGQLYQSSAYNCAKHLKKAMVKK